MSIITVIIEQNYLFTMSGAFLSAETVWLSECRGRHAGPPLSFGRLMSDHRVRFNMCSVTSHDTTKLLPPWSTHGGRKTPWSTLRVVRGFSPCNLFFIILGTSPKFSSIPVYYILSPSNFLPWRTRNLMFCFRLRQFFNQYTRLFISILPF